MESGYRVRGYAIGGLRLRILNVKFDIRTARGSKIDIAKSAFAKYGSQFEVVDVNDIASDDIAVHLEGVSKVIHIAANLGSGRGDTETVLKVCLERSVIDITLEFIDLYRVLLRVPSMFCANLRKLASPRLCIVAQWSPQLTLVEHTGMMVCVIQWQCISLLVNLN